MREGGKVGGREGGREKEGGSVRGKKWVDEVARETSDRERKKVSGIRKMKEKINNGEWDGSRK